MPPKAKKKKPSPLRKNPEDRAQIVSTSVPPDLKDYLKRFGAGKLTRALRQAAFELREKHGEKFPDNLS
jgi:hypothetical protein